jgi:CheY-like chemotaxis protein
MITDKRVGFMATLLVVEDEAVLRESIVEILILENYTVLSAANGIEALTVMQQHKPDLILCDIVMPEMDGYQLLEKLRADKETAYIPVIFLTARIDRESMRQGIQLGAEEYLTKPFVSEVLLKVIQERLQHRIIPS